MSAKLSDKEVANTRYTVTMNTVALRCAYYRANPQRFCEDYLNIHLKLFQQILIYTMMASTNFMFLAARGLGKSFMMAVFCVCKAILYPGTWIVITSKTRGQANEVLEKIVSILAPASANLRAEIDWKRTSAKGQDSCITFHNGSSINVVCANENARHNRAHVLIIDEYRMVPLNIIQEVLKRFMTVSRHPGFLDKPEYKGKAEYLERNQEMYASSCWYTSHWAYELAKDYAANMLDTSKHYFMCSLPYQLAIKENLLMREAVENEMSESTFSQVKFRMEMEALWFNENEQGFYHYAEIDQTRKILYPWLPSELSARISDKHLHIPSKLKGEKRILSADIAVMADHKTKSGTVKNDATSVFITQLQPGTAKKYARNVVYTTNLEGAHTEDQALLLRKLFAEFDCDYLAIDARGVGFGVVDLLMRDQYDPVTGITYPAMGSATGDLADRAQPGAQKTLWPIMGSAQFNSECALGLRESFRNGSLRLLISDYDADEELAKLTGWAKVDLETQAKIKMPYVHTTLLVNELVNLEYETRNGIIKIKEKSGMRKDRYSSLAYNNYVANQLERSFATKPTSLLGSGMFSFKQPKIC